MMELHAAAKQFYNLTLADPEVIIRPPSAEKRDAIVQAGEALRSALVAASPCAAEPTELQRIHEVVMNVGGDWPDDERDPYTLRHVKWMAREINKRTQA